MPSAAHQIRLGIIGLRGVGWKNTLAMVKQANVRIAAFCDIDDNVLKSRIHEFYDLYQYKPACYHDYRHILDRPDIDAVVISTPDHWHALQTIHACQAGKDVYVEKPLANYVDECLLMVKAAEKYGRKVQVGQQQRSGAHWQSAVKYIQGGGLGHIRLVRAWAHMPHKGPLPKMPTQPVPAGVNYDAWLGPAPLLPFNPNRFHHHFRWYWHYAGGLMTDWGVHMLDIALWALPPTEYITVSAYGGKLAYPDSDMETPDTLTAIYKCSNRLWLWEHALGLGQGHFGLLQGIAFYGEHGTLVAARSGWKIYPEMRLGSTTSDTQKLAEMHQTPTHDDREAHCKNFIDSICNSEPLACPVDVGCKAAIVAQLGNIAYRAEQSIQYHPDTHSITSAAHVNHLTQANYRYPYRLEI